MREITTLYQALLHRATLSPDSEALIEENRRWTYHELLMASDRAADMFWQLGLRKGDKAAIVLRNCAEFLIAQFALARIGAASVPVNFMITRRGEIEFILKDSGAKAAVTSSEFAAPYLELAGAAGEFCHVLAIDSPPRHALDFWHKVKTAPHHHDINRLEVLPDDTATLLYTSGTTGHPKGVILTHKNLLSNTRSAAHTFHVDKTDVFLCLLPLFHTFAFTVTALIPLLTGGKTVITPRIAPAKPWLYTMGREGVSIMVGVPQIFSVIAKEARGLARLYMQHWAFRRVRCCFSGAAPLSAAVHKHFEDTLGISLFEGYGLTETAPIVSANHPHGRKRGSVGRPVPGVQVKIVDEAERTLPHDREGEICVRGPNVTRGYHGNRQATKEMLTADGWFKTGDIGLLDGEGFLFIRDRKKDMIIVKGLKVYPAQVEAVAHEHPAVAEAAVIGVPDEYGEELIKCFVTIKPGAPADKHDILKFLRSRLDPYKRPRDVEILEAMPKNTLNKILKRDLRRREAEKLNSFGAA
ncbi:MAG: AMP-binding protein [Elusimicrobiales bacterium]